MPQKVQSPSGPVSVILDRLDGVQQYGQGWRAKCPACGGNSRKLSITEAGEGRVLIHCFAMCDAAAVMQAINLSVSDLFPEPLRPQTEEERKTARRNARQAQWGAALAQLGVEVNVVLIAANDLGDGVVMNDEDRARLRTAAFRIDNARKVLHDPIT